MLRILVAEKEQSARETLLALLDGHPGLEVAGVTDDGRKAVAMCSRLRPGLVLMGVALRSSDGLYATSEIMIDCPTPILIVSGSHTKDEVDLAVRALRAGALSVIDIPGPGGNGPERRLAFLSKIEAMAEVKLVRRWRPRPPLPRKRTVGPKTPASGAGAAAPDAPPPVSPAAAPASERIVAIAASTGGPAVLEHILQQIGADFPAPVLIVQHIASGFIDGVAAWLDQISQLRVLVAQPGAAVAPGCAYLAPDDRHLGVTRGGRILLSADPPINGFRPSASHLFDSVGKAYGPGAIAVILTGMGSDGCNGLRTVRREGGFIIAQDEATSVVFGMPRVAIEAGLADVILPRGEIGKILEEAFRDS